MKKLIFAAFALLSLNLAGFSQASPAVKKTQPQPAKVVTMKPANAAPATTTTTTTTAGTVKPAAKTVPASTVVLKKDGTPDKRYKASSTVPVKKDGTPDMRYKTNKKPANR